MHEVLKDWNTHNIHLLPVLLLVHRSCPYLLLRNRVLNVFSINFPPAQIHKHILLTTKKLSPKLCYNRGSLHVNNLKQGSTKGGKIEADLSYYDSANDRNKCKLVQLLLSSLHLTSFGFVKSYLINNCKFLKLSCLKVTNVGKTVDRVMSMSPKIEGHCS